MRNTIRSIAALAVAGAVALLLTALPGDHTTSAASFVVDQASLGAGQSVTSASSTNGNRTRFYFVEATTNPNTKAGAAFVQWAPLMPKAGAYRNGSLVDKDQTLRVWINGVWYDVSYDGEKVSIR